MATTSGHRAPLSCMRAQHQPPDAAEAVDGHFDAHAMLSRLEYVMLSLDLSGPDLRGEPRRPPAVMPKCLYKAPAGAEAPNADMPTNCRHCRPVAGPNPCRMPASTTDSGATRDRAPCRGTSCPDRRTARSRASRPRPSARRRLQALPRRKRQRTSEPVATSVTARDAWPSPQHITALGRCCSPCRLAAQLRHALAGERDDRRGVSRGQRRLPAFRRLDRVGRTVDVEVRDHPQRWPDVRPADGSGHPRQGRSNRGSSRRSTASPSARQAGSTGGNNR